MLSSDESCPQCAMVSLVRPKTRWSIQLRPAPRDGCMKVVWASLFVGTIQWSRLTHVNGDKYIPPLGPYQHNIPNEDHLVP